MHRFRKAMQQQDQRRCFLTAASTSKLRAGENGNLRDRHTAMLDELGKAANLGGRRGPPSRTIEGPDDNEPEHHGRRSFFEPRLFLLGLLYRIAFVELPLSVAFVSWKPGLSQQHITSQTPVGATLQAGGATFKVWAPQAKAVYLHGVFGELAYDQPTDDRLLGMDERGYWTGFQAEPATAIAKPVLGRGRGIERL